MDQSEAHALRRGQALIAQHSNKVVSVELSDLIRTPTRFANTTVAVQGRPNGVMPGHRFAYTGWLGAQRLVPFLIQHASDLLTPHPDELIIPQLQASLLQAASESRDAALVTGVWSALTRNHTIYGLNVKQVEYQKRVVGFLS